jgi:hypothetical protein
MSKPNEPGRKTDDPSNRTTDTEPAIYASLPSRWAARLIAEDHCLGEVDYWCILALHLNQDWNGVRKQIAYRSKRKRAIVSKFTPGRHYHVLGEKFDRLADAISYLNEQGYGYGGFMEKFAYTSE